MYLLGSIALPAYLGALSDVEVYGGCFSNSSKEQMESEREKCSKKYRGGAVNGIVEKGL